MNRQKSLTIEFHNQIELQLKTNEEYLEGPEKLISLLNEEGFSANTQDIEIQDPQESKFSHLSDLPKETQLQFNQNGSINIRIGFQSIFDNILKLNQQISSLKETINENNLLMMKSQLQLGPTLSQSIYTQQNSLNTSTNLFLSSIYGHEKLDICFLYSNPIEGNPVRYDLELAEIKKISKESGQNVQISVINATINHLESCLSQRPKILHIMCHGVLEQNLQECSLIFEDDSIPGQTKKLKSSELDKLLEIYRQRDLGIELIFVNACHSEIIAKQFVHEYQVPYAVAISSIDQIQDQAARSFSTSFYQNIFLNSDIQKAFDIAQSHVKLQRGVCCCTHDHLKSCKWNAFRTDQGEEEAHQMHEFQCNCNSFIFNQYQKVGFHMKACQEVNFFLETYSDLPESLITESDIHKFVCCCPQLEIDTKKMVRRRHDQSSQFRLITKENSEAKINIQFAQGQFSDVSQIQIPGSLLIARTNLYGRNTLFMEIIRFLVVKDDQNYNRTRVMVIRGPSQVGKTSLVNEAVNYIYQRGYFLNNIKFEEFTSKNFSLPNITRILCDGEKQTDFFAKKKNQDLLYVLDNCDSLIDKQGDLGVIDTLIGELVRKTQARFIIILNKYKQLGNDIPKKIVEIPMISMEYVQSMILNKCFDSIKQVVTGVNIVNQCVKMMVSMKKDFNFDDVEKMSLIIDSSLKDSTHKDVGLKIVEQVRQTFEEGMKEEQIEKIQSVSIRDFLIFLSNFPKGIAAQDIVFFKELKTFNSIDATFQSAFSFSFAENQAASNVQRGEMRDIPKPNLSAIVLAQRFGLQNFQIQETTDLLRTMIELQKLNSYVIVEREYVRNMIDRYLDPQINPKLDDFYQFLDSAIRYVTSLLYNFYFEEKSAMMDERLFYYDNFFSQLGIFRFSIFEENKYYKSIKFPDIQKDQSILEQEFQKIKRNEESKEKDPDSTLNNVDDERAFKAIELKQVAGYHVENFCEIFLSTNRINLKYLEYGLENLKKSGSQKESHPNLLLCVQLVTCYLFEKQKYEECFRVLQKFKELLEEVLTGLDQDSHLILFYSQIQLFLISVMSLLISQLTHYKSYILPMVDLIQSLKQDQGNNFLRDLSYCHGKLIEVTLIINSIETNEEQQSEEELQFKRRKNQYLILQYNQSVIGQEDKYAQEIIKEVQRVLEHLITESMNDETFLPILMRYKSKANLYRGYFQLYETQYSKEQNNLKEKNEKLKLLLSESVNLFKENQLSSFDAVKACIQADFYLISGDPLLVQLNNHLEIMDYHSTLEIEFKQKVFDPTVKYMLRSQMQKLKDMIEVLRENNFCFLFCQAIGYYENQILVSEDTELKVFPRDDIHLSTGTIQSVTQLMIKSKKSSNVDFLRATWSNLGRIFQEGCNILYLELQSVVDYKTGDIRYFIESSDDNFEGVQIGQKEIQHLFEKPEMREKKINILLINCTRGERFMNYLSDHSYITSSPTTPISSMYSFNLSQLTQSFQSQSMSFPLSKLTHKQNSMSSESDQPVSSKFGTIIAFQFDNDSSESPSVIQTLSAEKGISLKSNPQFNSSLEEFKDQSFTMSPIKNQENDKPNNKARSGNELLKERIHQIYMENFSLKFIQKILEQQDISQAFQSAQGFSQMAIGRITEFAISKREFRNYFGQGALIKYKDVIRKPESKLTNKGRKLKKKINWTNNLSTFTKNNVFNKFFKLQDSKQNHLLIGNNLDIGKFLQILKDQKMIYLEGVQSSEFLNQIICRLIWLKTFKDGIMKVDFIEFDKKNSNVQEFLKEKMKEMEKNKFQKISQFEITDFLHQKKDFLFVFCNLDNVDLDKNLDFLNFIFEAFEQKGFSYVIASEKPIKFRNKVSKTFKLSEDSLQVDKVVTTCILNDQFNQSLFTITSEN